MSMSPPSLKKFAKGDRVFVRAQQTWIILVAQVMMTSGPIRNRLITYGELADRMQLDPRAAIGLGRELGIVGWHCTGNGLPGLNCIVIAKETNTPGPGVVHGKKSWRDDQREVFDVDWFQYRVPTTGTLRQVWEEHSQ
jgi:hypothetical protein